MRGFSASAERLSSGFTVIVHYCRLISRLLTSLPLRWPVGINLFVLIQRKYERSVAVRSTNDYGHSLAAVCLRESCVCNVVADRLTKLVTISFRCASVGLVVKLPSSCPAGDVLSTIKRLSAISGQTLRAYLVYRLNFFDTSSHQRLRGQLAMQFSVSSAWRHRISMTTAADRSWCFWCIQKQRSLWVSDGVTVWCYSDWLFAGVTMLYLCLIRLLAWTAPVLCFAE